MWEHGGRHGNLSSAEERLVLASGKQEDVLIIPVIEKALKKKEKSSTNPTGYGTHIGLR